MANNKIKRIELVIHEEHEIDFYQALWTLTQNEKLDESEKNFIVDSLKKAVHFDMRIIDQIGKDLDESNSLTDDILHNIFDFLENSSKFQADYRMVSKGDFVTFKESDFIKEVLNIVILNLMRERLLGTQKDPEIKILLVGFMAVLKAMVKGIGLSLQSGLNKAVEFQTVIEQMKNDDFKMEITKDMTMRFYENETVTEEKFELYVEENGKIVKLESDIENVSDEIHTVFLKIKEIWFKMELVGASIVSSQYELTEPLSNINDLLSLTPIKSFHLSEEQIAEIYKTHKINEEGVVELKNILVDFASKAVPQESEQIVLSEDDDQGITIFDSNNSDSFNFTPIEEIITEFIKEPDNERDNLKYRNKIIKALFEITDKHYSNLTNHTKFIVVGIISSQIGLLNNEDEYIERPSSSSYREYLKETVRNALKSKLS